MVIYRKSQRKDLEEKLIQMYHDKVSFEDMEKETGLKYNTIQRYLTRLRSSGRLERERRKGAIHRRPPKPYVRHYRRVDKDFWSEEGIKCTKEIQESCQHGASTNCLYGCNYMNDTGHSRGCPVTDCHRYVKGSKITKMPEMDFS